MRNIVLISILFLSSISCKNSNDDAFIGEYYTLLPVKVGIHPKDSIYTLDFGTIVLILQGENRKSQYDALDIFESYLYGINVSRDSSTNELMINLAYNLDNTVRLFADTAESMIFGSIGPPPFGDIYFENIEQNKDYISFNIAVDSGEYKSTYQVKLYSDGQSSQILLPDSIIGKVNTELNPLYLGSESGMLRFRTIDLNQDVDINKHKFYLSNYELLKDSISRMNSTDPNYHIIENSIDYLKRCIAIYE